MSRGVEEMCELLPSLGVKSETSVRLCPTPSCDLLRSPEARCELGLRRLRMDLKAALLLAYSWCPKQPPLFNYSHSQWTWPPLLLSETICLLMFKM